MGVYQSAMCVCVLGTWGGEGKCVVVCRPVCVCVCVCVCVGVGRGYV